ncbi:MAG TPA: YciI family protein [Streptosporangiaceae bacterium]|nr:YciI family protein [Streptosporangiaceae bacterium]
MTRFLLLVNYDNGAVEKPMLEWDPADLRAHLDYYNTLNAELTASGELIGGERLAWPEASRIVRSDGKAAPVVTDGPYAEAKEQLAGFQMFDVESLDRAIEIAALLSAVPGPGGVPMGQPIEVRQVMEDDAELGIEL